MRQVAILEAGSPPPALIPLFGRYPAMFGELLGSDRIAASYDVARGEYPGRPEEHDAYLITGSAAGVYDDLPWIAPLKRFLVEAKGKAKLVGVCFGHQVMAEAFGGRVEKSAKGWGVGLQRYRVVEREPWMDESDSIAVPASHQDQVIEAPPATRVVASSDFCEFGILAYDDQPAISLQCHPEFRPDYAAALIKARRDRLPDPDAAIVSLQGPNDSDRIAQWIGHFLDEI